MRKRRPKKYEVEGLVPLEIANLAEGRASSAGVPYMRAEDPGPGRVCPRHGKLPGVRRAGGDPEWAGRVRGGQPHQC